MIPTSTLALSALNGTGKYLEEVVSSRHLTIELLTGISSQTINFPWLGFLLILNTCS